MMNTLPDTIHRHATREKSYRTKIQCAMWSTLLFGGLALLFTLFSNFWCRYASNNVILTSKNNGSTIGSFPVYHGLWNYQTTPLTYSQQDGQTYSTAYRACTTYGNLMGMDSAWDAARAFSIVATVLGVFSLFLACLSFMKPILWCCVSMLFALATLSQGLTFLFFKSNVCNGFAAPAQSYSDISGNNSVDVSYDERCRLGTAAKLGIAAICLWFLGALASCVAAYSGGPYFRYMREWRHRHHDPRHP